MGRAPCCEKMGLKKGPWSPEEDQILINYINTYGHANWRALPKHAGLLRCGKSCRLRWTNYLRPDIKRGNITREEEDQIIKLHEMLGNSDGADYQFQLPIFSPIRTEEGVLSGSSSSTSMCDGMDFWYDVYARAEEITEVTHMCTWM